MKSVEMFLCLPAVANVAKALLSIISSPQSSKISSFFLWVADVALLLGNSKKLTQNKVVNTIFFVASTTAVVVKGIHD